MDNFEKLQPIFSKILGVELTEINLQTSMDTIQKWDSLKHMSLVIEIEKEFSVDFEDEEVELLTSMETILAVIQEKQG